MLAERSMIDESPSTLATRYGNEEERITGVRQADDDETSKSTPSQRFFSITKQDGSTCHGRKLTESALMSNRLERRLRLWRLLCRMKYF